MRPFLQRLADPYRRFHHLEKISKNKRTLKLVKKNAVRRQTHHTEGSDWEKAGLKWQRQMSTSSSFKDTAGAQKIIESPPVPSNSSAEQILQEFSKMNLTLKKCPPPRPPPPTFKFSTRKIAPPPSPCPKVKKPEENLPDEKKKSAEKRPHAFVPPTIL